MENLVFSALQGKGVTEKAFEDYLEEKGYRLIKQGNLFRKKAYQRYAEYKKIEFRYWLTEYKRNTKELILLQCPTGHYRYWLRLLHL